MLFCPARLVVHFLGAPQANHCASFPSSPALSMLPRPSGVVPGLPRIVHMVAGAQHVLLSDGERVWMVGRALGASGEGATETPWSAPVVSEGVAE